MSELNRIADALDEALDDIRAGEGNPLTNIELLAARLRDVDSGEVARVPDDEQLSVEVYQVVRYGLSHYGTPQSALAMLDGGGWDDSISQIIEDRVVIYRDQSVVLDTQPSSSLGIGPTQ